MEAAEAINKLTINDLDHNTIKKFKSQNVKRFSYMFPPILSFLVNDYKIDCTKHWKAKIRMILSNNFLQETPENIFLVENYHRSLINLRSKLFYVFGAVFLYIVVLVLILMLIQIAFDILKLAQTK